MQARPGKARAFAFAAQRGYSCRVAMMNDWDQQPGEMSGDYALLSQYLELGPARTVAHVQRNNAGYTFSYLMQLARAWLWEERAEAYDNARAEERKASAKRLADDVEERWAHDQLELAELATQVIRTELLSIARKQAEGKALPATALTQLMDRTHKWLQIKTGGKTDVVGATIDFEGMAPEKKALLQSEAMREVLAQIAKG